jgi:hypothetical protein
MQNPIIKIRKVVTVPLDDGQYWLKRVKANLILNPTKLITLDGLL